MTAPVCLISGVGPGTGSALARRFTEGGYRVALLARNEERLAALEQQLSGAKAYRCDVSDPAQIEAVASAVERDLGSPGVVIHNAVGGAFGTFREIPVLSVARFHFCQKFERSITPSNAGRPFTFRPAHGERNTSSSACMPDPGAVRVAAAGCFSR